MRETRGGRSGRRAVRLDQPERRPRKTRRLQTRRNCYSCSRDPKRTHELKTWPGPFAEVKAGRKLHEVRDNDRGFAAGDVVVLREWDPTPSLYTPHGYTAAPSLRFTIGHVSEGGTWGLPRNLCVFTLLPEGTP